MSRVQFPSRPKGANQREGIVELGHPRGQRRDRDIHRRRSAGKDWLHPCDRVNHRHRNLRRHRHRHLDLQRFRQELALGPQRLQTGHSVGIAPLKFRQERRCLAPAVDAPQRLSRPVAPSNSARVSIQAARRLTALWRCWMTSSNCLRSASVLSPRASARPNSWVMLRSCDNSRGIVECVSTKAARMRANSWSAAC